MLSKEKVIEREYLQVYDDVYAYNISTTENQLKPIKEYYFTNPHAFDVNDPELMDKAIRYQIRSLELARKFHQSKDHNEELRRIFKQIEDQKHNISKEILHGIQKGTKGMKDLDSLI